MTTSLPPVSTAVPVVGKEQNRDEEKSCSNSITKTLSIKCNEPVFTFQPLTESTKSEARKQLDQYLTIHGDLTYLQRSIQSYGTLKASGHREKKKERKRIQEMVTKLLESLKKEANNHSMCEKSYHHLAALKEICDWKNKEKILEVLAKVDGEFDDFFNKKDPVPDIIVVSWEECLNQVELNLASCLKLCESMEKESTLAKAKYIFLKDLRRTIALVNDYENESKQRCKKALFALKIFIGNAQNFPGLKKRLSDAIKYVKLLSNS